MEQTNLVVTPDGKSWDEVTRDTSYIGNVVVKASVDATQNTMGYRIMTEWRGTPATGYYLWNKDFAIAYDRLICLKAGFYEMYFQWHNNYNINTSDWTGVAINGTKVTFIRQQDADPEMAITGRHSTSLIRGDYVQFYGAGTHAAEESNHFEIKRV